MVNLGMDFGSTYTMVSIFENGEPRTVQSSHLMFHYPSIVCYDEDKNKYFYGTSARERLGKKGIVGFRGFKMLLDLGTPDAQTLETALNEARDLRLTEATAMLLERRRGAPGARRMRKFEL